MDIEKHALLHRMFWNKTPLEQLKKLFQDNKDVLSDEVKEEILATLEYSKWGKWYKKESIKKRRKQQLIAKEDLDIDD